MAMVKDVNEAQPMDKILDSACRHRTRSLPISTNAIAAPPVNEAAPLNSTMDDVNGENLRTCGGSHELHEVALPASLRCLRCLWTFDSICTSGVTPVWCCDPIEIKKNPNFFQCILFYTCHAIIINKTKSFMYLHTCNSTPHAVSSIRCSVLPWPVKVTIRQAQSGSEQPKTKSRYPTKTAPRHCSYCSASFYWAFTIRCKCTKDKLLLGPNPSSWCNVHRNPPWAAW